MSFIKRRIVSMWGKEKKELEYLLPLAEDYTEMLTLGYQMAGRMKPLLESGYLEDNPQYNNTKIDFKLVIEWMTANGWHEMSRDFQSLFNQSRKYKKLVTQNNE
jgi:hypothetical protein